MKNQFNFTAAELSATITISVIILLLITYNFFIAHSTSGLKSSKSFMASIILFEKTHDFSDSIPKNRSQDTIKNKNKTPRKVEYQIVKVDLNHCDTSDIKSIPMFGSARAKKVIEYRDQLGGFHSIYQLKEIFILQDLEPDFLEQYFTVQKNDYQKIKINSVTYEELKKHPYFDAYLSKQILKYREKMGPIHSIEELQKATNAYASLIEKMRPYIVFD